MPPQRTINTSKLSKKELEKLFHMREVEYQELPEKLGEDLHVLRGGPHFTAGHSALTQEA